MSKRDTPENRLRVLCGIVEHRQYAKLSGTTIDLFTASVVLRMHDALSAENRAKLLAMPVPRMVNAAYRMLERAGG